MHGVNWLTYGLRPHGIILSFDPPRNEPAKAHEPGLSAQVHDGAVEQVRQRVLGSLEVIKPAGGLYEVSGADAQKADDAAQIIYSWLH